VFFSGKFTAAIKKIDFFFSSSVIFFGFLLHMGHEKEIKSAKKTQ